MRQQSVSNAMLTAFGQVAIAIARWPSAKCPVPNSERRAHSKAPCSVLLLSSPQIADYRSPPALPIAIPIRHSPFFIQVPHSWRYF
ncbi:GD17402 [Drosophila simulans]|uniref:GD17402 n=1 Tax=Drosophila simulans TaxID=7240 RepID=B4R711_DROSI|nr:GD17402 [Drosophila simulans]